MLHAFWESIEFFKNHIREPSLESHSDGIKTGDLGYPLTKTLITERSNARAFLCTCNSFGRFYVDIGMLLSKGGTFP